MGVIALSLLPSIPIVLGTFSSHALMVSGNTVSLSMPITAFSVALLFAAIYLLFNHPRQLVFLLIASSFWLLVLAFVYKIHIIPTQKMSLLVAFLIFAFWSAADEAPSKPSFLKKHLQKLELMKLFCRIPIVIPFLLPIFATIPRTAVAVTKDLSGNYSYNTQIADYINTNTPQNAVILVGEHESTGLAAGLIPFLKQERFIYDIVDRRTMTYHAFSPRQPITPDEVDAASELFSNKPIYYVCAEAYCDSSISASWSLEQSFEAPAPINEEPFEQKLNMYKYVKN